MKLRNASNGLSFVPLIAIVLLVIALVLAQSSVYAARDPLPATAATSANTVISSNIDTDTTWTKAGNPYQVTSDVTVLAGVTLTIEPGVQVQFAQYTALHVLGRLTAIGSAAERITFTGTGQQVGWWDGLSIDGTPQTPLTTTSLEYVTLEYAGSNGYGGLFLEYATLSIRQSTFRYNSNDGIHCWYGGLAHLTDVTLANNQRYPLQYIDGALDPQLARLTITGNGSNAIALGGGTITGNHLWENLNVPYVVKGDKTVATGATLTIEPGVQVKFAQYMGLTIRGRLQAVGTTTQQITFTGDFPGGTPSEPGWWDGLSIDGTPQTPLTTTSLEYVTLEYAGSNGYGGLFLEYATLSIRQSTFRYNSNDGIHCWYGGLAHLTDVTLANNQRYPLQYIDGALDPQLARLTISGNGTNAIALGGGTITGNHLWENLNVPYVVKGDKTVATGATLTIEPGVQVQFAQYMGLTVAGRLTATGEVGKQILFTGTTAQPGWWDGITVTGDQTKRSATADLSYATIEYGGSNGYANVFVQYGRAAIAHSILRYSSKDGFYAWYGADGSVIETSQIVNNTEYGVRNIEATRPVLAASNWWGSPSGPTFIGSGAISNCNPGGTGSKVGPGVAFRPFLSSADADPGVIAPADIRTLVITPRRWFAPADNITRVFVVITLLDGAGRPIPGHQTRLSSSMGTVVDGGVTDVDGQSFAYLTSGVAGDAQIVGLLDASTGCDAARSQAATVTFTNGNAGGELMPEAEAPYMDSSIDIIPEPIVRGVPTRLRATLKNPNAFPIVVDGTFAYAQAGIGLAFGPVGEVLGQSIPAMGTGVIEVLWTPSVTGHYCVQFEYTARAQGPHLLSAAQGSGRSQRNLNVYPGPFLPPNAKNSIDKARVANDAIQDGSFLVSLFSDIASIPGGLLQGLMVGNILDFQYEAGGGINCALAGGTDCKGWDGPRMKLPGDTLGNLKKDPPRQDYTILATPEVLTFPPAQPGPNLPAARANAVNALTAASFDLVSKLVATVVTYDRYAGASQANNLDWSSRQADAYLTYLHQSALALIEAGGKMDAFVQEVKDEGITTLPVTADNYRAYQQRLLTQGFNAQELEAAHLAGLTNEGIAASLARRIAADPEKMAGDMLVILPQVAEGLRAAGNAIIAPPAFGFSISGGSGDLAASQPTHNLVRVFDTVGTTEVANPTGAAATLDLRVRRIDVPLDWKVTLSPQAPTLQPGQQAQITVTIQPGTAAVQGLQPRIAVEGYINNTLIGGIAMDVLLPKAYTSKPVYLPVVMR